jgi:hypothetical protein
MTSLRTLALALVLPERYVFDRLRIRIHHGDSVGPTHIPKDVCKNWYVGFIYLTPFSTCPILFLCIGVTTAKKIELATKETDANI